MNLLSPASLAWLAALPVVIWLWRFAATRRRVVVPSLVPFEHLLERMPKHRGRLVVNKLFWLQIAALGLLALALSRPTLFRERASTTLVVVDTSASMGARFKGQEALERAKKRLYEKLGRKKANDLWFIVSSAPVAAVTQEPLSDAQALRGIISEIKRTDLSGSLSTAARIGQALLGGQADQVLVVTDEPVPQYGMAASTEIESVGEPAPNLAIVGADAQGALCSNEPLRAVATVQNFSSELRRATVRVQQENKTMAQAPVVMQPGERAQVPFDLSMVRPGWIAMSLDAEDALAADNRVYVRVRRVSGVPVALDIEQKELQGIVSAWTDACEGLKRADPGAAQAQDASILVTDREIIADSAAGGILHLWGARTGDRVSRARWLVDRNHAIGTYFESPGFIAAAIGTPASLPLTGEAVIWGLHAGRKIPVVMAGAPQSRRQVWWFVDPLPNPENPSLIVLFLNSLRWLMGQNDAGRPGEPLVSAAFDSGKVTVREPNGSTETFSHPGGPLRYDATTQVGFYRLTQGRREDVFAVNLLDPAESNLMERRSSWRPVGSVSSSAATDVKQPRPLSWLFLSLALGILLLEWWLYTRNREKLQAAPAGKNGQSAAEAVISAADATAREAQWPAQGAGAR